MVEQKLEVLNCGIGRPEQFEFRQGGEKRATGMYKDIREDCERRSQRSINSNCDGSTPYHLSGKAIVRGEAKFIGDEPRSSNTLCLKCVPSPHAHAKIISIDTNRAQQSSGVFGILTWQDIPGENQIGHTIKDEPLLPQDEVCYVGQPVAIVVAESLAAAEYALSLIEIKYEKLPTVLSIEEALATQNFYVSPSTIECGNVKKAFTQADYVIEGTVTTGTQEQLYLETQRCLAVPGDDNDITLYSATQSTAEVQEIAARILGINSKDVVVDVKRLGGAFGGKERSATLWACLTALAAYKIKRPVELKLNRLEDQVWTGKRHPFLARYKVGFNKDGKILAYEGYLASNGGAYVDLSLPVTERAMFHSDNAYYIPNMHITGAACRTNLPPNTAFRGFGAPQGIFIIENIIEKVAEKLRLDPIKVREINCYKENDLTHYGQPVHDACHAEIFAKLKQNSQYEKVLQETAEFNKQNRFVKRGIGVMPVKFGISFTFSTLNQGTALIWIYTDGTIALSHGGIEMGQEVNTKVVQVTARALGVSIERIRVVSSNTLRNGNASPTAASSGADINCNAALDAAYQLKKRLTDVAVGLLQEKLAAKINPEEIEFLDDKIFVKDKPDMFLTFPELVHQVYIQRVNLGAQGYYRTPGVYFDREKMQGNPFYYFVFGATLVQMEVDLLTGANKLLQVYIVHETGHSINLEVDRGQIVGAFTQGFGYATMEDMPYDNSGRYLATTFSTYKVPTIRELSSVFNIETIERDVKDASAFGSKAIGEPPLIYGMASYFALRNAIAAAREENKASSSSINLQMPATPEAIVRAVTGK